MNYGIYISAEGAMTQSTRMEVIANNLANAATVGFKRDLAIAQSRLAEQTQRGLDIPGSRGINDLGGGVEVTQTVTDFAPGPIKNTGGESDLAIPGDGFFMIRRGNQDFLTRAGNFQFSSLGELITQDGDQVLTEDGEPVIIDPTGGQPRFTPDGALQQGTSTRNLALVEPASKGDLVKQGDNLYVSLSAPRALLPEERKVAAGHLEMSGVKAPYEMLEMIQTSRAFEANSNLIRSQDQLYGTLLSKLLKA